MTQCLGRRSSSWTVWTEEAETKHLLSGVVLKSTFLLIIPCFGYCPRVAFPLPLHRVKLENLIVRKTSAAGLPSCSRRPSVGTLWARTKWMAAADAVGWWARFTKGNMVCLKWGIASESASRKSLASFSNIISLQPFTLKKTLFVKSFGFMCIFRGVFLHVLKNKLYLCRVYSVKNVRRMLIASAKSDVLSPKTFYHRYI